MKLEQHIRERLIIIIIIIQFQNSYHPATSQNADDKVYK
jgi:hypothetical protein